MYISDLYIDNNFLFIYLFDGYSGVFICVFNSNFFKKNMVCIYYSYDFYFFY